MTWRGEIVAGLLCGLFAALWIATALGLPYLGDYAPGSGFLPLWLGVCLLVLVRHPCRVEPARDPLAAAPAGHWRKVVAVDARSDRVRGGDRTARIRGRGGSLPSVPAAGVEKESWRTSLGVTIGTIVVLFGLFRVWLQVPLPKGPWGF